MSRQRKSRPKGTQGIPGFGDPSWEEQREDGDVRAWYEAKVYGERAMTRVEYEEFHLHNCEAPHAEA